MRMPGTGAYAPLRQPADRQPSRQQQRVFLARALAQESSLYLMDEPFAGVDAVTEKTIVSILKGMRDRGKP